MMGRQHALCGLGTGLVIAGTLNLLTDTSPLAHAVVVLATGGAALLPDLDHPSGTAARSLGLLTKTIARGIDWLSLEVYYATRTDRDHGDRHSGHRLVTHTLPGWLFFAVVVGLACLLSPIAGGVVIGLLSGLLALGIKKRKYSFGLSILSGFLTYYLLSTEPFAWWAALSVCVFIGCAVHSLGDWLTNSGVPILYPLVINGKRWYLSKAPITFSAGDAIELMLVTPVLFTICGVSALGYLGTIYLENQVI
jgi:membrane-bound metal-dependent hydrolase YbcI (DUF457 family)